MVFSSLIFLWLFLPLTMAGYFIVPAKIKNIVLLLTSLFFYAWGEPVYILLMLFSITVNWGIGLLMEEYASCKKTLLVLAVLINLGLIGYFKYFNFLIESINSIFHTTFSVREIGLPIGISFFTFQILSYVIDLYRGHYPAQKNIINLALYISFFPQLIAGPIVRYTDINEQLQKRSHTFEKTAEGIRRFIYGLGKKVLAANTMALCADWIYGLEAADITGWMAWSAAIFYTLQIYFDFSGYSDMAIGLGKMFGFEFLENFHYPYLAKSIQEFWQRWHISLGTWFREYLYIPLGGNRKGKKRTYFNLIVVFFATGLWHGASVNFILWGLYHGAFSIIERLGFKKVLAKHKVFAHIYTLLAVVFGWVLFRVEDLAQWRAIFSRMLMPWRYMETTALWQQYLSNRAIFVAGAAIAGSGIVQLLAEKTGKAERWKNSCLEYVYCAAIFVLCLASLAGNTYNPFIYFRF